MAYVLLPPPPMNANMTMRDLPRYTNAICTSGLKSLTKVCHLYWYLDVRRYINEGIPVIKIVKKEK